MLVALEKVVSALVAVLMGLFLVYNLVGLLIFAVISASDYGSLSGDNWWDMVWVTLFSTLGYVCLYFLLIDWGIIPQWIKVV